MKAILILDIPDDSSCIGCPCMALDDEDDWIGCHLTAGPTGTWSEHKAKRPNWCPLKPIVFCEECKYADELGEWSEYDYSCRHFNTHSVNKGNFCSYGEKKG